MAAAAPLRHHLRGTLNPVTNGPRGAFVSTATPLERFRRFCQFDPTTGCVLWIGGIARGHGKSAPYGSFWAEGKRWFAHRWAAANIHGLDIEGFTVDHCCPPHRAGGEPLLPNTLCVQHVAAETRVDNTLLAIARRTWILTQKGIYEPPPTFNELEVPGGLPFYVPPAWLGLDTPVNTADDECPF